MLNSEVIRMAEEHYQAIVDTVERVGHSVTYMPAYGDTPPAAFTTGAALQGLPDLIILGLSQSASVGILNKALPVVAQSWPFPSKTRISGILENFDAIFRDVSKSGLRERKMQLTAMFNRRHGLQQTPILQLYYPDPNGRYPFEPDCDPAYARGQKLPGLGAS